MLRGSQLYVGNLDERATEDVLYELFVQVAKVKGVRLPKDKVTKRHQGFAFVEFHTGASAQYAMDALRGVAIYDRTLKISEASGAGGGNGDSEDGADGERDFGPIVFVGNLDMLVDKGTLQSTFASFGEIRGGVHVVRGEDTNHAFVTFRTFEAADKAIEGMNGKLLMNKALRVDFAYKTGTKDRHGDSVERELWQLRSENVVDEPEQKPEQKPKPKPKPNDPSVSQGAPQAGPQVGAQGPAANFRGAHQPRGGHEQNFRGAGRARYSSNGAHPYGAYAGGGPRAPRGGRGNFQGEFRGAHGGRGGWGRGRGRGRGPAPAPAPGANFNGHPNSGYYPQGQR